MARFCIVAPPQILDALDRASVFGGDHLLLAHDIVNKDKQSTYQRLFDPKRRRPGTVILDNSVVELGNSVDIGMIRRAARYVRPDYVVLPDVMGDAHATIASAHLHIEGLYAMLGEIGSELMYLPQGQTIEEFAECAFAFATDARIKMWGVPRNVVKYHKSGSRQEAIEVLHALNPSRPIHMFGFSDNMIDDLLCAQNPYVNTIDSAVPMRVPTAFNITMKVPPRAETDWWENGQCDYYTFWNLRVARDLFAGRGQPS